MTAARVIFPIVMTGIIALIVTLVATLVNLGPEPGFVEQWLAAYVMAWPVAAFTAFFAIPVARRLTDWLVARI